MTNQIKVTSHVARDFLQNAAYFSTVPKVVWEYVSNAIDNPGDRDSVNVEVRIIKERIIIEDSGSGMTRNDLNRFFTMHGENIQRKQGKKVRGRFGTGKCAAFGIASKLRIETVRAGLLNIVELDRQDILASSGEAIPVRDIAVDAPTSGGTGTRIIISGLHTKQLEIPGTISYVQRHLGRQHQSHSVVINDHLCELEEPVAVKERQFEAPAEVAVRLGSITATIKVSPVPLEAESAGIDVFSYGNWHDTTLAGLPVNELTRRIFGEVEVQALEDYDGPFPPFDNTRNNTLSPQNPLVVVLFGWLGACIREVVQELEAEEAERKRSAEAKVLRAEADKIAKILNDDLRSLQLELEKARKVSPPAARLPEELVGVGRPNPDSQVVLPDNGGEIPIDLVAAGPEPGDGHRGTTPAGVGDTPRPGSGLLPGDGKGVPRDPVERPRRSPGFHLEFLHETESAPRSRYEETTKTIVINLDHPQLRAARKLGGQESTVFRQISYELAFVEYAMALGNEHVRRDPQMSGEDALYEIRDTINRITRRMGDIF